MLALKGKKQTPEHIKKRMRPDVFAKISKAMKGRIPKNLKYIQSLPKTEKYWEALRRTHQTNGPKISAARMGHLVSSETRRKLSIAHMGKKLSIEHRHKIATALSGSKSYRWKGGITPKINKRCNSLWWKQLRKIIYARDKWICQSCFKKCLNDIQCHHIVPEKDGVNHTPDNLITLCKSCHIQVERLT